MTAIGSPDRIPRVSERRLDQTRRPSCRGDNKNLTQARRCDCVVRSVLREERNPLAVRREPRSPSVVRNELGRAAAGDGLYVDATPVSLGTVNEQTVIRREVRIGFVEVATGQPYRFAGVKGPHPDGEPPISFAIRRVGHQLPTM